MPRWAQSQLEVIERMSSNAVALASTPTVCHGVEPVARLTETRTTKKSATTAPARRRPSRAWARTGAA